MGSCDTTRAQTAAKQMAQALTHVNCETPYVISDKYHQIVNNSSLGIEVAKDDGIVLYVNDEIIVFYYKKLDELKIKSLPLTHKTTGILLQKYEKLI